MGGTISGAPAAKEGILIFSDPRKHLSNTELVAIFSWISVAFLSTALAVEINFVELRILGYSPPTQAQVMIGNSAPLLNGHCG